MYPVKLLFVAGLMASLTACGATTRLPEIDDSAAKAEAEKQREFVVMEMEQGLHRLHRIGLPILRENAPLCEKKRYTTGMRFAFWRDANKEFKPAIVKHFDLGDHAKIVDVPEGTPAAAAGLESGDEIIEINGSKEPSEPKHIYKWVADTFEEMSKEDKVVSLSVLRGGEEKSITIEPVAVCGYPVQLKKSPVVNAFADGSRIVIHSGMMDFTRNDDELALIVGHELAHNTMLHVQKGTGNQIAGAVLGALIGALIGVDLSRVGADVGGAINSQEFEAEADYVGVYYTARAGFDVSNVANLWRRMAANNPRSIHLAGTTHPSTAKRFLAIEQTASEIAKKKSSGKPLVPEDRGSETAKPAS